MDLSHKLYRDTVAQLLAQVLTWVVKAQTLTHPVKAQIRFNLEYFLSYIHTGKPCEAQGLTKKPSATVDFLLYTVLTFISKRKFKYGVSLFLDNLI